MPEVIDLLSSSPPRPQAASPPRAQQTRPRQRSTTPSLDSLDIGAPILSSLSFIEDDFGQPSPPTKRRKTDESSVILGFDESPKLPAKGTKSRGGLESDPIMSFTSSIPERETARQKHKADSRVTITIDSDDEDAGKENKIGKFSDPFGTGDDALDRLLNEDDDDRPPALLRGVSDRTAALLASLGNNSKTNSTRKSTQKKTTTSNGPRLQRAQVRRDVCTTSSNVRRRQQQGNHDVVEIRSSSAEVDSPEPHRKVKKSYQKLSVEEKEARAREREAARAQREREKEAERERRRQEKEEKAREKQLAADLAAVNKLKVDKKVATPEMIIDLATTFRNTSVGNQVEEFMRHLGVELTYFESTIPGVIKWRRKVKATYNEEAGHWEPCAPHIKEEEHVLCMVRAQEFVDMVLDGGRGETLELHVTRIKSAYPNCTVIYLIEGLDSWMRKNRNSRNRAYQAAVRRQMAGGASNEPSSQEWQQTAPSITDDDAVEDGLLQLQVIHHCLIHQTEPGGTDTADCIRNFTEHISTVPYRRERMQQHDTASFCMESGQVRTGEDKADTFVKMLQEINRVTPPVAYGVAARYPSVTDLFRAMRRAGPQDGPLLLQDVPKSANRNGAATDSRIGPALSRRMYRVLMGTDPGATDV